MAMRQEQPFAEAALEIRSILVSVGWKLATLRFSRAQFGTHWGILRVFRQFFWNAKICANPCWTRFWEWCRGAELNRRHTDFQSVALPTELPRHSQLRIKREFLYHWKRKKSTQDMIFCRNLNSKI
jgi:hypothetical protein